MVINKTLEFSNTYVKPASISFDISKELIGIEEGDSYTFDVSVSGNLNETVSVSTDTGKATTSSLKIDSAKDWIISFKEKAGTDNMIRYDSSVYVLSFTSIREDNKYVIDESSVVMKKNGETISYSIGDEIKFSNLKYKKADTKIVISKTITGLEETPDYKGEIPEDRVFYSEITVKDAANNTVYQNDNMAFSVNTPAEISLSLDKGTYTVTAEEKADTGHYAADTETKTFTITVAPDGDVLKADKESYDITFTNEYQPVAVSGYFGIYKTVSGDAQINSDDTFNFTVTQGTEEQKISMKSFAAARSVVMINYSFDKTGTYVYTIHEDTPTSDHPEWYTLAADSTVTVTVKDNSGVLEAEITGVDADKNIKIVNTFTNNFTPLDETIYISKKTNTSKEDQFIFSVQLNPEIPAEYVTASANGDAEEYSVSFSDSGLYTYTVREETCSSGYTCDTNKHTVSFKVVRDGYNLKLDDTEGIKVDGVVSDKAELAVTNTYS